MGVRTLAGVRPEQLDLTDAALPSELRLAVIQQVAAALEHQDAGEAATISLVEGEERSPLLPRRAG